MSSPASATRISPWGRPAAATSSQQQQPAAARSVASPWGRAVSEPPASSTPPPVVQQPKPPSPPPPVPEKPAPIAPDLTVVTTPEPIQIPIVLPELPPQKPAASSVVDIPPPPGPPPPPVAITVDIPPPPGPPPPLDQRTAMPPPRSIPQRKQQWQHSRAGSELSPELVAGARSSDGHSDLARMSALVAFCRQDLQPAIPGTTADSRRRAQSGSVPKPVSPKTTPLPNPSSDTPQQQQQQSQEQQPGTSPVDALASPEDSVAFRTARNPVRDSVMVDSLLMARITDDSLLGTRSQGAVELAHADAAAAAATVAPKPLAASSQQSSQESLTPPPSHADEKPANTPQQRSGGLRGMFSGLRTRLTRGSNTPSPSQDTLADPAASPTQSRASRKMRATVAVRGSPSPSPSSPDLSRRSSLPRAISQSLEGSSGSVFHPQLPAINECHGDPTLVAAKIREMAAHAWDSPELVDHWTSLVTPFEQWVAPADDEQRARQQALSLVDFACMPMGYNVEVNSESMTHTQLPATAYTGLQIVYSEEEFQYYREFVSATPHENYVSPDGPTVVSIQLPSKTAGSLCKAIIRTKRDDRRVLLPMDKRLKMLKVFVPALKDVKLQLVKVPRVIEELGTYEDGQMPTCAFKIGVLYVKPHQTDENEIYSNVETETSRAYREFLEFLGEKVPLQGWTKYRAGLDVTDNNTGTHSVFTQFRERYDIMFHVATMLPFQPNDAQRIERKRHIGNDVVVIVFKEPQADEHDLFNPATLTSHFIHCCFVVTPTLDANGDTTHYTLTVSNKAGVPPYSPFLPQSPRFEKNTQFREFLLTKIINAGRVALGSPEFQSLTTARKLRLGHICQLAMEANSK